MIVNLIAAVLTLATMRVCYLVGQKRGRREGYEACHRHMTSKLATAQFFRRPQLTRRRPEAKS